MAGKISRVVEGSRAAYRHLDWYDQLIDTWVEKFPEHCVLISYQDMVEHTQDVLGRIAQFCGVEAPASPPFTVGDDGGCAESYQALLREARG